MQSERDGSIAEALKVKSSISEVAERFSVSRPTLYKYMDFYDSGETERIPREIREYFDMMSSERTTKDDSQIFLIKRSVENEEKKLEEKGSMEAEELRARKADLMMKMEQLERRRLDSLSKEHPETAVSWTDEDLGSLSIPENGATTVFFRGGLGEYDSVSVIVSIISGDGGTDIGTYTPEEGMSFVRISNLPRGLHYTYRIEMSRGPCTMVSDSHRLEVR